MHEFAVMRLSAMNFNLRQITHFRFGAKRQGSVIMDSSDAAGMSCFGDKSRGAACNRRSVTKGSKTKSGRDEMRLAAGFRTIAALALLAFPLAAYAAEMRGVTATEIKIGQTMPYSGPVSAFGALGKGEV